MASAFFFVSFSHYAPSKLSHDSACFDGYVYNNVLNFQTIHLFLKPKWQWQDKRGLHSIYEILKFHFQPKQKEPLTSNKVFRDLTVDFFCTSSFTSYNWVFCRSMNFLNSCHSWRIRCPNCLFILSERSPLWLVHFEQLELSILSKSASFFPQFLQAAKQRVLAANSVTANERFFRWRELKLSPLELH